jgi:hypothetical protein
MGALKSLVRPRYTKRQKNPFPSFFSIENPRGNWLYVFITALLTSADYETAPPLSTGILFFLQPRFFGQKPHAQCRLSIKSGKPVWHYFDFFVRLASASVPSEALTIIS